MVNDIFKIKLESIAAGGDAIGRINGKPVFIEGGAVDETVMCQITEDHKTWARAQVLEIIERSPGRVDSICKYYGHCGGCNLQHINYSAQLAAKINILKNVFSKIAKLTVEPQAAASPPFEYRNRMQFHCIREKTQQKNTNRNFYNQLTKEQKFGLKERRSNKIIAVNDCPIAVQGIKKILQEGGNTLTIPPDKDRFTVFSKDKLLLSEGGSERGIIRVLDKDILLDAGIFFQSNVVMLEKLVCKLREVAEEAERDLPMADLYCGGGTFAIFLNDLFPKIVLAEENKKAIALARENLKRKDVEFFALRDSGWETLLKYNFGFMIADPPRAGLAPKVAKSLAAGGPPLLAYVSCDPSSLARDCAVLTQGGYVLKELTLFDFYPQTAHIESLGIFVKIKT